MWGPGSEKQLGNWIQEQSVHSLLAWEAKDEGWGFCSGLNGLWSVSILATLEPITHLWDWRGGCISRQSYILYRTGPGVTVIVTHCCLKATSETPWDLEAGPCPGECLSPTLYPDYTDIFLCPLDNLIYSSVYCWHFPLSGQTLIRHQAWWGNSVRSQVKSLAKRWAQS